MDDAYRALARAIRQPMRRWWLRVGVWWLGLTLAYSLWHELVGSTLYVGRFWSLIYGLDQLIPSFYLLLILVVATLVIRSSQEVLRDWPYPHPRRLAQSLFLLILVQCIPVVLAYLVDRLVSVFAAPLGNPTLLLRMYYCYDYSSTDVDILLFGLWLVALAVTVSEQLWLPWVWAAIIFFVPGIAATFAQFGLTAGAGFGTFPYSAAIPDLKPDCGWAFGLLAVVLMMRLYQASRRREATTILALMMIVGLHHHSDRVWFLGVLIADHPLRIAFDFVRNLHEPISSAFASFQNDAGMLSGYYWDEAGRGMIASDIPFSWGVVVPVAAIWLVPLLNALYIAAVIAFIYYVILAPPRRVVVHNGDHA